ncbi:outer membrane autotransporter barrel domain protein [Rhodobacter capsulatus SB 1003]|uniref:Outer membrane autotransporter barrel domain protein n=1 Tax=Rhodobacter capsulatus (strain ATCC BAA-309 / NBRC 16581 / SB1003) TaxID=272942 RepID=D5ASH8_RHOCB|nr:hypothetical protein [Rhodobacter capsulatus]ADE85069.1 outer membrane autotransporter barrel domain protein [Rhodobacter capsulatus SB 1003]
MARNMTTQISHTVPPGDLARSGLTGVARHLLSVSVIALLFGLSPAAAQFRIDRNTEASEESSGVIQGTVGYLADTTTATGGDNLGDHVATMPLNMSGFSISGIATPDGTDPGAGVNVQYVDDMFGAYTPPEQDLSNYVTKSGMPQTITSAKTFDGPVLFSDDVQVTKVPASTRDVTNKAYVDDAVDDLVTLTTNQSVSGDKSFTGSVAVRTPTGDMGAANKLYVDNAISVAGGSYVTMGTNQIIGGTPITGAKGFTDAVTFGGEVNVTSAPDDANDAANKAYVDSLTDGLAGRVTVLEGDVTALTASVTTLQGDVSTLDTRVTNLANRTITAGSGITASGTLGGGITVAVDPTVVRTSGNQTLAGVKNFSSLPTVPTAAPTLAGQVASKAHVDAQVASAVGTTYAAGDGLSLAGTTFAVNGTVVRTTGDQTLAGVKTFSAPIAGSITGNAATATKLAAAKTINGVAFDGSAGITLPTVNTTGAQAVAGVKTFSDIPVIPITAPTVAGQVASKAYVDAQVAGAVGTTYAAGDGLCLAGTTFAVDGTVVRTSGDQTLAGVKTFSAPIAGSITGNAATATELQTARTINGVAFDGGANITLPTVNTTGAQTVAGVKTFSSPIAGSITGNAATASELQTARTINGVAFDGGANITLPTVNTTGAQAVAGVKTFSDIPVIPTTAPTVAGQVASKAYVDAQVAGAVGTTYTAGSGLSLTGTTFAADGTVVRTSGDQTLAGVKTFSAPIAGSITGNAATATKLASARTINGVAFDGTAGITLPTVNTTGAQAVAGVKTFSDIPILPVTAPTSDLQAVNKAYADTKFGIGSVLSTTDDFDDVLMSGYHKATTGISTAAALALNRPSGQPGMLEVLNNGGSIMQRYSTINSTGTFYRTRNSSGVWFAWKPFASYNAGDGIDLDVTTQTFAVDATVVRTTGTQSIAGTKTFSGALTATGTVNLSTTSYVPTMGTTSTALVNKGYVDGGFVDLTTAETIGGTKTFSAIPVIPTTAPTAAGQVASKAYVDSKVGATYTAGDGLSLTGTDFAVDGTVVRTAGAQTLAGVKTFMSPIAGSITGNAATATKLAAAANINGVAFDGSAAITLPTVNTSGAQAVAGLKTFSTIPQIPTSTPTLAAEVASKGYVDSKIVAASSYAAGSGLALSGNVFSADNTVVRTSGAQTLSGVKTFNDLPLLPAATPTLDNQVASKAYADTKFGAGAALTTTDDFNTVVDTNFYKVSTGIATAAAIALNRPSGQPGILEVVNNGNVLVQRYSTLGAKGTFYRTRTSAGTWASWASVADYGAGDGLTLDAATNDFAVDDTVIRDSGAQSIAGTKTFTGTLTGTGTVNLPAATYVPTMGTTSTAVANKAYADTKVSMTGNQAISGVKSFAAFPTVPVATDPTADNQVVSKKYADSLALNITRSLMLPYFNILVRATDSLASTGTARHDKITIAAVPVDMKRVVCFTLTRNSSFVGDDSFEKEECYIVQEGDVIEVKSSSFGAVVIAINNEDQVNDFSFPSRTKISGPFLFIDEQSPASTPFIYNFSGYSNHEGSSQLSTSISVREYLMPNVSP